MSCAGTPPKARKAFDDPQQRVRVLPPGDLAVGLARVRQHRPEQPRPPALPGLAVIDRRPTAEIDLQFLARAALQAAHQFRLSPAQPPDKALHRLVGTGEPVRIPQFLVDADGAQPLAGQFLDGLDPRLALARTPRGKIRRSRAHGHIRPGGRNSGWFWVRRARRPGGRNAGWVRAGPGGRNTGWFWRGLARERQTPRLMQPHVAGHRLPVQIQHPGDAAQRIPSLLQNDNRRLHEHLEHVRHRVRPPKRERNLPANFYASRWLVLNRPEVAGFE